MIRTIIVDDEKPSRDALSTYIRDYCPDIEIVSECDCVKSAFKNIIDKKPQLVFLDIEMPNGSGFDLLKMFKPINFKVIFVTAFSEYAIKAFRYSATDYLLKPVKVDELVESVNKVHQELKTKSGFTNLETLLASPSLEDFQQNTLVIADSKGFTVVKIPEIIMCKSESYLTHFYLTGKVKITSSKNLKHYEEILKTHNIVRVHNSFLVSLTHVKSYSHQGEILLSENNIGALGNSYKNQFINLFREFK